jgi:Peptidase S46
VMGGAFERATGRDPFALPKSWLVANDDRRLNLSTPFNMATSNDIIGGNSGSPVFNKDLQIVGLIFDGNIQSLGGEYGFDPTVNRAISVCSPALVEALDHIYGARRIVAELRGGASQAGTQ